MDPNRRTMPPGFGGYQAPGQHSQGRQQHHNQPSRQPLHNPQQHHRGASGAGEYHVSHQYPPPAQHPQMHLIQPITSHAYHHRPDRESVQQRRESEWREQQQRQQGMAHRQLYGFPPNRPQGMGTATTRTPAPYRQNLNGVNSQLSALSLNNPDAPPLAPASVPSCYGDDDVPQLSGVKGLIAGVLEGRIPQEGVDIGPWHHGLPPPGGFPSFFQAAQRRNAEYQQQQLALASISNDSSNSGSQQLGQTNRSSTNPNETDSRVDENEHVNFDGWDDSGPRLNLSSEEAGLFLWGGSQGMERLIESGVYCRRASVVSLTSRSGDAQSEAIVSRSGTTDSTMTKESGTTTSNDEKEQGNEEKRMEGWGRGDSVVCYEKEAAHAVMGEEQYSDDVRHFITAMDGTNPCFGHVFQETEEDKIKARQAEDRLYRLRHRQDPSFRLETLELAQTSPFHTVNFTESERASKFQYRNAPMNLGSEIDGSGPFGEVTIQDFKTGHHAEVYPHVDLVQSSGTVQCHSFIPAQSVNDDTLIVRQPSIGNLPYNELRKFKTTILSEGSDFNHSIQQYRPTPIRPPPGLGFEVEQALNEDSSIVARGRSRTDFPSGIFSPSYDTLTTAQTGVNSSPQAGFASSMAPTPITTAFRHALISSPLGFAPLNLVNQNQAAPHQFQQKDNWTSLTMHSSLQQQQAQGQENISTSSATSIPGFGGVGTGWTSGRKVPLGLIPLDRNLKTNRDEK